MNKIVLLLFIMSFSITGNAQSNYADQRLRADSNPETRRIRREFRSFIKKTFRGLQSRHRLNRLKFTFNDRMIAQYGRGSASAFKELPKDLNLVMEFIRRAKTSRAALLTDLSSNYTTLRQYSDDEILKAITSLANSKTLHLDYWGYLSTYKAPTMDLKTNRLSYFAEWKEGASYYKPTHKKQLRSNIIRGIIANLNHTPWYSQLFN